MVSCGEVHAHVAQLRRKGITGDELLRAIDGFCREAGILPEELEVINEVYSLQVELRRPHERREAVLDEIFARECQDPGLGSILSCGERGLLPVGGLRLA